MPKVVYKHPDHPTAVVEGKAGQSLMVVAIENGIAGIDAICGGQCACATCHVHVDAEWFAALPPVDEMESELLSLLDALSPRSRLSCQVRLTDELDGISVTVPAET